jgi:hypothetical protein
VYTEALLYHGVHFTLLVHSNSERISKGLFLTNINKTNYSSFTRAPQEGVKFYNKEETSKEGNSIRSATPSGPDPLLLARHGESLE